MAGSVWIVESEVDRINQLAETLLKQDPAVEVRHFSTPEDWHDRFSTRTSSDHPLVVVTALAFPRDQRHARTSADLGLAIADTAKKAGVPVVAWDPIKKLSPEHMQKFIMAAFQPHEDSIDDLAEWILDLLKPAATALSQMVQISEELILHLRKALDERDELRRRLMSALESKQHAEDRLRVLEAYVMVLEAQLREATAAIASGNSTFMGQSKAALRGLARGVVSLLALGAAVGSPFIADHLNNDDIQELIEAQKETTQAIESMAIADPIDLSIEAALRCVVDHTAEPP